MCLRRHPRYEMPYKNNRVFNIAKLFAKTYLKHKYVGTSQRFFIVYLRDNGIPVGNIVELFKEYLIGKRGGRTEWQHCLHEKQIEFIYSKSSQYSFPDCDSLKKKRIYASKMDIAITSKNTVTNVY